MAREQDEQLRRLLAERLRLVEEDPAYEGTSATSSDQLMLALVGLVIPALLMLGGWVLYGG